MSVREQDRQVESPYARAWVGLRLVLAAGYVVLGCAAAVLYQAESTLGQLYADLDRGSVSQVRVVGDVLPPTSTGSALQEVTWRTGSRAWRVELVQVRGSDGGALMASRAERTTDDVVQQVRARSPEVDLEVSGSRTGVSAQAFGVSYSGAAALPVVVLTVAGLLLLVGGPQPWRATRWGWFWLCFVPGGPLVYLARSGPTPGLRPPAPDDALLTGGRALVAAVVLGLVANAGLALLATALWPGHV